MENLNLFGDSDAENFGSSSCMVIPDLSDFGSNLEYYHGELGNFWYNSAEFEIIDSPKIGKYLHYCGKGKSVNLPKGCTNTRFMFENCNLPDGFTLGDKFDTSNVGDMNHMFKRCRYDNISFREYFKTDDMKSIIALLKQ